MLRLGLLLALLPLALSAQVAGGARKSEPCEIVITGVGGNTRLLSVTSGTGAKHTYVGGGVDASCAGQGNRLLADSAEHYADRGLLILFNNVRYTEEGMALTSNKMTYTTNDEHLLAEGNVRARSASGTRFTGPRIEYFRDIPGLRPASRWVATGRPTVRMSPSESSRPATPVDTLAAGATRGDSVDLTANTVISENDSLMWASGNVIIERTDLRATADSATLDNGREFARLMRQPVVVGLGERPFTLHGTVIDLWSRERQLERVLAAGEAKVVSDSLTLTADTIDMRLSEQQMERVYTWGGRSVAVTPSQRIEADSLEIIMPAQRLREVHAVGDARATSRVDSTRIISSEPDWIRGDTIVAQFDTVDTADTTSRATMREVLAVGSARSFYQLAPSDGTRGAPNISYNRGRVIKVSFESGEVTNVDVVGGASGIFLEPTPADTTRGATTSATPSTAPRTVPRTVPRSTPRRP